MRNREVFDALPRHVKSPSPRLREVIQQKSFQQKTSVAAGTTTDSSSYGPLAPYAPLAGAFVEMIRLFSALEIIIPDTRHTLLRTMIPVAVSGASAVTITESAALAPSQMAFALVNLDEFRVAGIIAATRELIKFARPGDVAAIGNDLARACGLGSDQRLLTQLDNAAGTTHASSGSTAATFQADLAHSLDMISYGSGAKLYCVLGPDALKRLATLFLLGGSPTAQLTALGGVLCGVRFVISDAITDGSAYVLDASQLATFADVITLDVATQATLQLANPPAGAFTNLYQQDLVALKADRFVGVQLLRGSACSKITGLVTTA